MQFFFLHLQLTHVVNEVMVLLTGHGVHPGGEVTAGNPRPSSSLFPLSGCPSASCHEELRDAQ